MKRKPNLLAEYITWGSIAIQYAVGAGFLYYGVALPFSNLKLAVIGLAVALISTGTMNLYNARQTKKLATLEDNQTTILQKLDNIQRQTEHSLVGDTLANIADYLINRGDKK